MNTKELDSEYIIGTYKRQDVVLVEGHGAVAHDETGKEYIDFGSGIGVNSLGYCDEKWADAVAAQAHRLQHASNLYYTQPAVRLAKLLCEQTGYRKALFCNSGAEANECAIKIARKYSFDKFLSWTHCDDAFGHRAGCLSQLFFPLYGRLFLCAGE